MILQSLTLTAKHQVAIFAMHNSYQSAHTNKRWYSVDGLNSLRYTVVNQTDLPLYTWIQVDLKGKKLDIYIYICILF